MDDVFFLYLSLWYFTEKNCVLPTLHLVATLLWIEVSPIPADLALLERSN